MMIVKKSIRTLTAILLCAVLSSTLLMASTTGTAAQTGGDPLCTPTCKNCDAPWVTPCDEAAVKTSEMQTAHTNEYIRNEFIIHREWMVKVFFEAHILPAMMLMTEQISAMAMYQVKAIGSFFDAKHQLETQRLLQEMTAQAHKDYHPSEGMCTFGTSVRSLAASDRNTELSARTISKRIGQRELLSGDSVSGQGATSDFLSRLGQFRSVYCNPKDNGSGLDLLCPSVTDTTRANRDIDYTATIDSPLTLALDFSDSSITPDEEDVFALSAHLYANTVAPVIPAAFLSDESGVPKAQGATHYMNIRALAAKRSVAYNSYAAVAGMKAQGEEGVQPYLYALMKEMGVSDEDELKDYLGDRPSYYAQMEVMTKKLYQNPAFYTELYDKPANVARKNVSMQAIELMQRRDIYRSMLRSEAILSVMLETALSEEQERLTNEINVLGNGGTLISLP